MEPTSLYNLNKIQKLSLSMCIIKNGACFTIFIYSCMLIYTWLFIYVVYMYIYICVLNCLHVRCICHCIIMITIQYHGKWSCCAQHSFLDPFWRHLDGSRFPPFQMADKSPHDHRPAHSGGLSKPIKPTGQALTLINPFHKRHYYIILTLQKIYIFFYLTKSWVFIIFLTQ